MTRIPHLGVKGETASAYIREEAEGAHNIDYRHTISVMAYSDTMGREKAEGIWQEKGWLMDLAVAWW
ncbi:predicted protein [Chaetomium globosum CBS 148.51]|uniref:Uncharacterized protein n=1 Tax=Chaetomium globosum (strain ATCC 6205 / CBS 148.51 / DSM 1962 / NBRC 6347 / NRRL 1970) TaxID=306901 RepID=Q2GN03_CHAGB|nr:uncharacterized protein CHGG_10651 [Chaetomium globosum CBS 148.51]EAQ84247.1 predicted protein [Chaetomium globosum CBS 148.51]